MNSNKIWSECTTSPPLQVDADYEGWVLWTANMETVKYVQWDDVEKLKLDGFWTITPLMEKQLAVTAPTDSPSEPVAPSREETDAAVAEIQMKLGNLVTGLKELGIALGWQTKPGGEK